MGQYMKKRKITGNVAGMEIPQVGVRTRARTLALQPNPDLSYLQLRSRRLEKIPHIKQQPCSSSKQSSSSSKHGNPKEELRFNHFENLTRCDEGLAEHFHDVDFDPSFGQNNLEYDPRERSTHESTPCSLIRDSEAIATPVSTTRALCSSSANPLLLNNQRRTILATPEMEDFFAGFELDQHKFFLDKYNYDIMNDLPLPGRYEWISVDN